MSAPNLYLDDLVVGQRFESGEAAIDVEAIVAFARQFDPQPFHLDAKAAETTPFRGLAASGWHTMALTMRLIVESVPFAHGIIGAGGEIAWPLPTRPGDRLRVESIVREIRPSRSKPDQGIVAVESLTRNQNGETVQTLVAKLLAFRRTD